MKLFWRPRNWSRFEWIRCVIFGDVGRDHTQTRTGAIHYRCRACGRAFFFYEKGKRSFCKGRLAHSTGQEGGR